MSDALAERLRRALSKRRGVTEKRMFGGVCFLLNGNMICGSTKSDFMFRVGRAQEAEALARKGARPMDFTGRPMAGFIWVDPASCDARGLARWVALAESYVGPMPRKAKR
jgi:TfoX/Sxy family transcriptional regulator of competence genes